MSFVFNPFRDVLGEVSGDRCHGKLRDILTSFRGILSRLYTEVGESFFAQLIEVLARLLALRGPLERAVKP
jgi:hypothetical protein